MLCPNCKIEHQGNVCKDCGLDFNVYKRIDHLSNRLYNQGLDRLKNNDYCHALEYLKKSITINKKNVTARNLLGLALFEVGHVGEALKHWVVSQSIQKVDNPASAYLDKVHKNTRSLERMNDAVTMYNNALIHIRNKSDDLAVIQLKKSVEINPKFIDAHNLLTLCYLIQNERVQAAACIDKVLSVDSMNPIALSYYATLHPNRTRPVKVPQPATQAKPQPSQTVGPYKTINIEEKKHKNFHISEILSFIFGVVGAAAIMYFLIVPQIDNAHAQQVRRAEDAMDELRLEHAEQITSLEDDYALLETQITQRDGRITALEHEADVQDRIIRVHQAFNLFSDGQFLEAVHLIDDIDQTGLPFDIRGRIEQIYSGSYPPLALHFFNTGRTAFQANDDHLAIVELEQAQRFIQPTQTQYAEFLNMLGTLYFRAGDRDDEAVELLTELQNNFPNFMPITVGQMLTTIAQRS